jgi:hypothetical protein
VGFNHISLSFKNRFEGLGCRLLVVQDSRRSVVPLCCPCWLAEASIRYRSAARGAAPPPAATTVAMLEYCLKGNAAEFSAACPGVLATTRHTAPHTGVVVTVQLRSNERVAVLERPRIAKQAMLGPLTESLIEEAKAIHMRRQNGRPLRGESTRGSPAL